MCVCLKLGAKVGKKRRYKSVALRDEEAGGAGVVVGGDGEPVGAGGGGGVSRGWAGIEGGGDRG